MLVLILVSMVMSHASVDLFALQKPRLNYLNFIVLLSRRRLDAVLHLKAVFRFNRIVAKRSVFYCAHIFSSA